MLKFGLLYYGIIQYFMCSCLLEMMSAEYYLSSEKYKLSYLIMIPTKSLTLEGLNPNDNSNYWLFDTAQFFVFCHRYCCQQQFQEVTNAIFIFWDKIFQLHLSIYDSKVMQWSIAPTFILCFMILVTAKCKQSDIL